MTPGSHQQKKWRGRPGPASDVKMGHPDRHEDMLASAPARCEAHTSRAHWSHRGPLIASWSHRRPVITSWSLACSTCAGSACNVMGVKALPGEPGRTSSSAVPALVTDINRPLRPWRSNCTVCSATRCRRTVGDAWGLFSSMGPDASARR
jgi:hypothetical protein